MDFLRFGRRRDPSNSSADSFMGIHTIMHDGMEYMTRYWFWRFRVHVFHRGDYDVDCHDHPWDFWTFPFSDYLEEVATEIRETRTPGDPPKPKRFQKTIHVVKAWRLHGRKAEHCHRVLGAWDGTTPPGGYRDAVAEGKKIVTFVYQAGKRRSWGFLKLRDGRWCWQGWKEYVLQGGRNAPCG